MRNERVGAVRHWRVSGVEVYKVEMVKDGVCLG